MRMKSNSIQLGNGVSFYFLLPFRILKVFFLSSFSRESYINEGLPIGRVRGRGWWETYDILCICSFNNICPINLVFFFHFICSFFPFHTYLSVLFLYSSIFESLWWFEEEFFPLVGCVLIFPQRTTKRIPQAHFSAIFLEGDLSSVKEISTYVFGNRRCGVYNLINIGQQKENIKRRIATNHPRRIARIFARSIAQKKIYVLYFYLFFLSCVCAISVWLSTYSSLCPLKHP